jgi:hypothetical protein
MFSQVKINSSSIETKVTKGQISSVIKQTGEIISITSNQFELVSDNLEITKEGTLTVKGNGVIKGSTISGSKFITTSKETDDGTIKNGIVIENGVIHGYKDSVESGKFDFSESTPNGKSAALALRADNFKFAASDIFVVRGDKNSTSFAQTKDQITIEYYYKNTDTGSMATSKMQIINGFVIRT